MDQKLHSNNKRITKTYKNSVKHNFQESNKSEMANNVKSNDLL